MGSYTRKFQACCNFLIILITPFLLAGCAEFLIREAKKPLEEETFNLKKGNILIFGEIVYILNGKRYDKYNMLPPHFSLARNAEIVRDDFRKLKRNETIYLSRNEIFFHFLSTERDGTFYYSIPAGDYLMYQLKMFFHNQDIYPALSFSATEPGKAYYLGTITVDLEVTRQLGGLVGANIDFINFIDISDEFSEQHSILLRKYRGIDKITINKSLITKIPNQYPLIHEPLKLLIR